MTSQAARRAIRGVASSARLVPALPSMSSSAATTKLPLSRSPTRTRTRHSMLTKWLALRSVTEPRLATTLFTSTSVIL